MEIQPLCSSLFCARRHSVGYRKKNQGTDLAIETCAGGMVVQNLEKWPINVWFNLKPLSLRNIYTCLAQLISEWFSHTTSEKTHT